MFTLFQNFADLCLKNYPFFLIARIRAYLWKITPFLAKVGTSVVYVLIGSRGVGGGGGGKGEGEGGVSSCSCLWQIQVLS